MGQVDVAVPVARERAHLSLERVEVEPFDCLVGFRLGDLAQRAPLYEVFGEADDVERPRSVGEQEAQVSVEQKHRGVGQIANQGSIELAACSELGLGVHAFRDVA